MIKFPKKNSDDSAINTSLNKISLLMGAIFSLPPLSIFLGIAFGTGQLIVAAVVGFGFHFVILAFSAKIARYLDKKMN